MTKQKICGRCVYWVHGKPFQAHCGINGKQTKRHHRCDCVGAANGELAFHPKDNKKSQSPKSDRR